MKTTINEEDGKFVVTLEGRLDTAAADQTVKDIAPLYEKKGRDIVIDCQELSYISSSGLRILLGIRKHAGETGNTVTILHMNNDIKSVFQMTGFINLFTIQD